MKLNFTGKIIAPLAIAFFAMIFLVAACGGGSNGTTTLKIITTSSFAISEEVIQAFEEEQNIKLEILESDDTGTLISQIVLTKGNPVADVAVGIDNAFIQNALAEAVFVEYESPGIENISFEFRLNSFVTPIYYGDVCLNYWVSEFANAANTEGGKPPPPESLDDLTQPIYKGKFVTENPETSSPGLAFMLATIAKYGEDGWLDYWRELRQNGIAVTSGWTEAYNGEFTAGGGDRPIVTSYASSPVAEVFFSDASLEAAPTEVIGDGCFRQIGYAGILKGTNNEQQAEKVIDWFLSKALQEDLPLTNFVYPVNEAADLPAVFEEYSPTIENPLTLSPALIAEKRAEWTTQWVDTVLR